MLNLAKKIRFVLQFVIAYVLEIKSFNVANLKYRSDITMIQFILCLDTLIGMKENWYPIIQRFGFMSWFGVFNIPFIHKHTSSILILLIAIT